jgi:ubiquitin carboxyl-terminal hydrolase 22/27/51
MNLIFIDLNLLFKRFEHSNRIHKKIFDHISFPELLDMSPFMSSNLDHNTTVTNPDRTFTHHQKSESYKYFLFAVVNHIGTLESGHYTSFIRLKNNEWFKCDDHVISKASLDQVLGSEG